MALTLPAQAEDHFLAIGVCPPWKPMPNDPCTHAVAGMSDLATEVLGVPADNVSTLLNADATVAGFQALLHSLPAMDSGDRLFLYVNLHNGSATAGQHASADDDVMVFWSEQDPQIIEFAVAEGLWLPATQFAQAVLALGMGEIVLILDACESDAVTPLFLHAASGPGGPRVATIASAQPGQWANLNGPMTLPLFTDTLLDRLTHGTGALPARLAAAVTATTAQSRSICSDRLSQEPPEPGMTCNQVPILHDPDNILADLVLDIPS